MTGPNPLPPPEEDATTAPWWEATRHRRLLLQTCEACGHAQHYPRPICLGCHAIDPPFREASGTGTVHAATAVHRAPHRALLTPYVIALVDLSEGPRLMTRLVADGEDPAGPSSLDATALGGAAVRVGWWPLEDGRALPIFIPHPTVDEER